MKKLLPLLLFALAPLAVMAAAPPVVPAPPQIPANGYILVDHQSGRVLAEQRADERMEPASITKVMSAYVVFEALKDKRLDRKSTRLNSSHVKISYAVFCLKKKK